MVEKADRGDEIEKIYSFSYYRRKNKWQKKKLVKIVN